MMPYDLISHGFRERRKIRYKVLLMIMVFSFLLFAISLSFSFHITSVHGQLMHQYDYVDNNTSDVDASADKGTHSNFAAEQDGPDGVYDTLTENNTGRNMTLNLYVDAFDNARTGWNRYRTSPYLNTQNHPTDYVRLGIDQIQDIGDFGFQDSGKSLETINSVILRLYAWKERSNDRLWVYLWDGSSWGSAYNITRTSEGWTEFNVTDRLNTWPEIDGVEIYLDGNTVPSDAGRLYADCAMLRVGYTVINYEFDLEVQWTNVTCDLPYEKLCIFGGTMGSESIQVDVWNGSAWDNLFTDLSSGWNNISVTNYLVSLTFTIGFKGATETEDIFQDSWEIDCTLLHMWAVPPTANFYYTPRNPYTSDTVTFNASGSYDPDGSIVSYFWDFGDENTGIGNITTHAYADNGNYTVTLTITDNDGVNSTASDTILVLNRPPVAKFTESSEIVDTDVVIYFNASESYDLDGFIVSYFWDFGDDANATGALVNHTYADDGIYTVALTVTDDDGATTSTNATKTVLNRPPVAIFTESAETVYTHEFIYFNASDSYDPDGTIINHFWDFDDGTNATGIIVTKSYDDNRTYIVTLTATDDDGATASTNATKTVLNSPPVANFTESAETVYTGETIYFNASDSYDPDGYIANYFWDFGDGTNDTGVTASHAYAEDGSYTVNLTVTDDDGSSAVATHVLTILNRAPVASFIIFPQQPVADDSVTFDAVDSYDPDGTIVNYIWDFGDGNMTATSSGVITHIYHEYGDFNVTLTIVDNDGYNNTTSQIINVRVHDIAILNATVSQTEVHVGQVVNITVTVKNEGTTTESFNVAVFRNGAIVGTQLVSNLAPNAEKILYFYWNATGITPDMSYAIRAEASAVAGETDIFDNTYSCGIVKVESQGPPPFDWGPIIPYVAPIGSAVIAVVLVIAAKKELLGLLLGALGGLSWLKKRKRRKGFEFFDEMTDGGIPDSFSVLISGEPGSGKSVLCQQLTHAFLAKGNSCIYITYDSFPDEVRENMERFHWNLSKFESEGKLVFIDSFSSIAKVTSKEKYSVNQPFSLSDLGIIMSTATNEMANVSRVFLDSIVPLLTHIVPSKVVEFLQNRSARIKGVKGTFIFTLGRETIEPNLISRSEEAVDCVIELEVSKGKTVRRMRIKKMRGRKTSGKWIRFEIDSKKGIVFLV